MESPELKTKKKYDHRLNGPPLLPAHSLTPPPPTHPPGHVTHPFDRYDGVNGAKLPETDPQVSLTPRKNPSWGGILTRMVVVM